MQRIKTLVFDMGNVLVLYDPERTMREDGLARGDRELLLTEVFKSAEWDALDRGTMEKAEAFAAFRARLPERLADYLDNRALRRSWMDEMPPFPEMYDLVAELKQKGYGLYLLSNATREFHTYAKAYPVMGLMDGKIISSDHRRMKPEPEIYRILFDTYRLNPAECLFVDDVQANIDGARRLGMDGICFSPSRGSVGELRARLREKGVALDFMREEEL